MNTFSSTPAALPRVAPLDRTKHVKYTLGMVLGVEDFDQEFAYLSGRDQWLARDLSGYGAVWGLRVGIEVEQEGPRVNVSPGTAVTPCGKLVCVTPAQCADLNEWLAANDEEVRGVLGSPPGTVRLYVVLCHRECETDDLPIPGEPCRTEDTLTAPSRLKDDFRLELRTAPPRQREEDAIRDVVAWLRAVPLVAGAGADLDDLLEELRSAASVAIDALGSPPSSPPGSPPSSPPGSPPAVPYDFVLGQPPAWLSIPAADAVEYLRAAFSLWVTELRPALRGAVPGCGCVADGSCDHDDEDCVLLAELELPVVPVAVGGTGALVVADDGWSVDETRRPYVLHTRFLQEWLLGAGAGGALPGSPPAGVSPISAVSAHDVVGPPTALWNPGLGLIELGIPAGPPGPGIDDVVATPRAAGEAPTANLAGGLLTLGIPAGQRGADAPQIGGGFVVAAGAWGPRDGRHWHYNDLAATRVSDTGFFFVTFPRFDPRADYVVKGTVTTPALDEVHTVERVSSKDGRLVGLLDNLPAAERPDPRKGLFIRVVGAGGKATTNGFELEISDFSSVAVHES